MAVVYALKKGMNKMTDRITLRIKFSKHGNIRFIGHLDVMRFFQKAIRRAQIDVSYTQGYSPHQIMSFASPLGVGLESDAEYMDLDVNSLTSCQEIKNRINAVSVPGIRVQSVKILPSDAGNAMASVAAASYEVNFRPGREPKLDITQAIECFLEKDHIFYTKETKKGTREIDLKEGIYSFVWEQNRFTMLLDASSAGNIKPKQVIEALLKENGEVLSENALIVRRTEMYLNLGSEEVPDFAPLDAIGLDTLSKGDAS